MRARLFFLLLFSVVWFPCGHAQDQVQPAISVLDGGPSRYGGIESIFVPPKPDAPFSLTLSTDWTRPRGGGGTFTVTNERRIVRDSGGRIYQERRNLVPKGAVVKSSMNVFQITDPWQHTWYNCDTQTKICELLTYHLTTENTYVPPIGTTGPTPDGNAVRLHEDLGTGSVQGVETHGYRETITVKPGAMGNNEPMVRQWEFWYSADLGFNLYSTAETPEAGKQVFSVTELTLGEPEEAYFIVPNDYKVVDHRREPQ